MSATIKQKRAFKEVGVNGGNISKAMVAAGYSVEVAKRTDKLTNTKGWQELMEEYLPDELLTKVHVEGLAATKIHTSHTEPDQLVPDFSTRHKYLETGYKIKNKIPEESKTEVKMLILRLDV